MFNEMTVQEKSPEYESYGALEHWRPVRKILSPEKFISPESELYLLFVLLYQMTLEFYLKLPLRKNGERSFIHPLNVMHFLKRASVQEKHIDDGTLIAGLLHDYVEESVDIYRKQHKLSLKKPDLLLLEKYEQTILEELRQKIAGFYQGSVVARKRTEAIVSTVALLTRCKQHSYYVYISAMFNTRNKKSKERAIHVKLADRIHNVLCIECFNERERIYQCFKNLFLLNNVKKYLLEKYGPEMWNGRINNITEKLFNKCIKATHDAFLRICHNSLKKGIFPVQSMLEMAFHKYSLLNAGLDQVTNLQEQEPHLIRLYQGIVRKYDALLHREAKEFQRLTQEELEYCRRFFKDYHFNNEQLHAIIDYKDAFALKEVLVRLLYEPKYFMSLFVYSELSKKGRIMKRENH